MPQGGPRSTATNQRSSHPHQGQSRQPSPNESHTSGYSLTQVSFE